MHYPLKRWACLCGILYLAAENWVAAAPAAGVLAPIALPQLCITEGSIEPSTSGDWVSVSTPKMRAYLNILTTPLIEARFRYLGPTAHDAPLASGIMRRQFGVKLRAQDACNLIYAMWRIEPDSKLVVSVKSNPGQHGSAQCGNRGYRNVKPHFSAPLPALRSGEEHALRALVNGQSVRVFADEALVWEGSLGADGLAFDGPVGVRSDNARLELQLRAGPRRDASAGPPPSCRSGPGEAE
jgi:hypothetical protein